MKNLTSIWNRKNYFKLFMFLLLFFAISNCRSSEEEAAAPANPHPLENPLPGYITSSGVNTVANLINAGDYEFGLVFSPTVNGKLSAIHVQIPSTNANLRVTIWDFDSKAILRSETINIATANTMITKAITSLELLKDKKYLISMNSNDWYERKKNPTSAIVYPITSGNIIFHSYLWKEGTAQVFPLSTSSSYYAGDLSFTFQQTD